MINLTKSAQDQLVAVLKDKPEFHYIRLGVRGGGCSGFEYCMTLCEDTEPDWESLEFPEGLKVVVDQMSMMYLDGVEVDYIVGLDASGFKFNNPNVKTGCGCGRSFSV